MLGAPALGSLQGVGQCPRPHGISAGNFHLRRRSKLTANRQACRYPGTFPQPYTSAPFRNLFQTGKLWPCRPPHLYGTLRAYTTGILCLWPTQLKSTFAETAPSPTERWIKPSRCSQPASWRCRSVSNQPSSAVTRESCESCSQGARDWPQPSTLASPRFFPQSLFQPWCGMECNAVSAAGARRLRVCCDSPSSAFPSSAAS